MKIGSRTQIAFLALHYVYVRGVHDRVRLWEISDYLSVSNSYLEQLFKPLVAAGLVEGNRGVNGGYRLARDASTVSLAEIADLVEAHEPLVPAWDAISELMRDALRTITVDQASALDLARYLRSSQEPRLTRNGRKIRRARPVEDAVA